MYYVINKNNLDLETCNCYLSVNEAVECINEMNSIFNVECPNLVGSLSIVDDYDRVVM